MKCLGPKESPFPHQAFSLPRKPGLLACPTPGSIWEDAKEQLAGMSSPIPLASSWAHDAQAFS